MAYSLGGRNLDFKLLQLTYRHCPHFSTLIFLVQFRFIDTETETPHLFLSHGTPSFSSIIQGCSLVQQTLDVTAVNCLGFSCSVPTAFALCSHDKILCGDSSLIAQTKGITSLRLVGTGFCL